MALKTILDYALDYAARGFSVIPIRPGPEKRPYIPWTEFQKRRATEEEIEGWFLKWPNSNIAIITGSISGIFVIDGDGEIGSRWISENLPKTSVYARTGRASGVHCFYRLPAENIVKNKVGWKPKVDIRGEGGYVIAAPSIHHTGNVYELIFLPGRNGWDDLHEFDPMKTDRMSGKGNITIGGNLGLDLSGVKTPEERKKDFFQNVEKGGRHRVLVGMVGTMFRAGGNPWDVWEIACSWNAKNVPPIEEKELKRNIKSIWELHEKNDPLVIVPEHHFLKTEIEEATETIVGETSDEYPIECLQPGGLLQEIMDYTAQSSASHKPIFALSAAIAIVGNVCGQKIMTETGLRTNMYCVSIGYSGAGKNASHSAILSILSRSAARITIGTTDTASGVALLKWISCDQHQVALFTFDEFGMLLQSTKNQASPMAELPRILTKIFSSTDRPEIKSYADAKLNITIPWHHVSLYASSTPGKFWGNLSEADSISGFLARLLIFEAHDKIEKSRPNVNAIVPKKITDAVDLIYALSPPIDKARGDMTNVPMPFVIPRSKEAQKVFNDLDDKYLELRNKYLEDDCKSSVYGRTAEHTAKLALIHCASLHHGKIIDKEVGVESVRWAIKTAETCTERLLTGIKNHVSKNAFHLEQQKLLDFLRRAKREMKMKEIYRGLHMPAKNANELISSLTITGQIIHEKKSDGEFFRIGK